jgi:hypothetical protein
LGAADALLEQIDAKHEALEKDVYEHVAAALRSEMGEAVFEAARRDGRSLAWTDVVEMA